jgi:hypothetical protein
VLPFERLRAQNHTLLDAASNPLINGYAARATWEFDQPSGSKQIGGSIRSFKAFWRVPDPPATESGQTIYLFIGMETGISIGNKVILQPVLQWGANDIKNWSVSTFCVFGTPKDLKLAAVTKAIPVAAGDQLAASIVLQEKVGGAFGYLAEFSGISGSSLYVNLPQELIQVGVALEVYNVMKLSDLPNSDRTVFDMIQIVSDSDAELSPIWELTNSELKYDIRAAAVVHAGIQDEIDIYYR